MDLPEPGGPIISWAKGMVVVVVVIWGRRRNGGGGKVGWKKERKVGMMMKTRLKGLVGVDEVG